MLYHLPVETPLCKIYLKLTTTNNVNMKSSMKRKTLRFMITLNLRTIIFHGFFYCDYVLNPKTQRIREYIQEYRYVNPKWLC